jgi:hypothetical protein
MSNETVDKNRPSATTEDRAHAPELGHGNSPAAWTCVGVMLLGALVCAIAFVLGSDATILFIIGVVIIVVGLLVGWLLRKAGYGVGGSKLNSAGH